MKKTIALLSTILLAGATASGSIFHVNAALTAPTGIDYAFRNNGSNGQWGYYADPTTYGYPDIPAYFNRTIDGSYYNYDTSFQLETGLIVEMLFNRSNTGWLPTTSGYTPYLTNKIGSSNTVGSVSNKIYIKFDNQTNKEFFVYFDLSSISNYSLAHIIRYNNFPSYLVHAPQTSGLLALLIPSYSSLEYFAFFNSSASSYIDAWYLEDLGISDAYSMGYEDGQNDQIFDAPEGIFGVFGNAFKAVANVLNIQILPGDITLGTVFGAMIALAVLFSFLNLLNATPRGGKK